MELSTLSLSTNEGDNVFKVILSIFKLNNYVTNYIIRRHHFVVTPSNFNYMYMHFAIFVFVPVRVVSQSEVHKSGQIKRNSNILNVFQYKIVFKGLYVKQNYVL